MQPRVRSDSRDDGDPELNRASVSAVLKIAASPSRTTWPEGECAAEATSR